MTGAMELADLLSQCLMIAVGLTTLSLKEYETLMMRTRAELIRRANAMKATYPNGCPILDEDA